MRTFLALAAALSVLCGCAGIPEDDVSLDLSVAELIQQAQDSVDNGSVATAEMYYQLILDRYSFDPAAVIAAEYELAHLKIRQKKWTDALPMIDAVIQKYDEDAYYQLPRAYLKLAVLDRQKIPAKILDGADGSEK